MVSPATATTSFALLLLVVPFLNSSCSNAFSAQPLCNPHSRQHQHQYQHQYQYQHDRVGSRKLSPRGMCNDSFDEETPGVSDAPRPYHEVSRQFRRTSFTHEHWIRHRSSDRLRKSLQTTFVSGVVRQLLVEISLVTSLALFVCAWNAVGVTGYVDLHGVSHDAIGGRNLPLARLPLEPFTLSSPALGLLLVFRTNASYGRWLQGRKYWGSIVNHCRNIVRLSAGWLDNDIDNANDNEELLKRVADSAWAFARSLQRHLWGAEDVESYERDIRERLPPCQAQALFGVRHKPTRALYDLTRAVDALPLPYMRRAEIDRSVTKLTEAMGGCERIFSSPVPLVYTRHTARFLGFWIMALPFGLYNSFQESWNHVELVPACVVISFFFLGVDELAIQLEEPFSILPLEKLVSGIRLSVDDHVDWYSEKQSPSRSAHTNGDQSLQTPFFQDGDDQEFLLDRETWEGSEDGMII